MTREDELSPEQLADIAALEAEVEREGARVGVDWEAAAPAMRTLARARRRRVSDDAFEVDLELDVTGMLAALRALPDAAGTAAFVAAFRHQQAGTSPPSPPA
jgi:hypothetical protein